MNKEKIIEKLEEFGLMESDAKVYLALLKLGECSVGEIEKETKLQRTTIYSSVNHLIELGLASYIIKNNIKQFSGVNPERFKEILEERKKDFKQLLPELKSLITTKEKRAKIKVFEGYKGMRTAIEHRINLTKKGDTTYIMAMANIQHLEKYEILIHRNEKKRVAKGAKVKVITPTKYKKIILENYGKYKLREDRFLDLNSPHTIIIYKNFVNITAYEGKELFPLVILIESEELADSYKKYFEILWKQARH